MSLIRRANPVPIRLDTARSSATDGEPGIKSPSLRASRKYLSAINPSLIQVQPQQGTKSFTTPADPLMGDGYKGQQHSGSTHREAGLVETRPASVGVAVRRVLTQRTTADRTEQSGEDEQHDANDRQPQQGLDGEPDNHQHQPEHKQAKDQTHDRITF
jgi:hypothetical protein